ncbi:MAG: beta-ketoacyl synthase N-terminal-like domain-containing protein [Cyanobacteria bacterium P01_H01_bin.105]
MTGIITGTGMVTSVGINKRSSFARLCAGQEGRRPLQFFDRDRFNLQMAYELSAGIPLIPHHLRASQLLVMAVKEAVMFSQLDVHSSRTIAFVGTGLRELRSLELWAAGEQSLHASELHFGDALRAATGREIPVTTLSNACSASNFALGLAEDAISLGEADVVIVAGCDSLSESMFGLSDRVNPLHPERVQPFDQQRRGVLLGEGAAAVVIESAAHAEARSANRLAELRSVGISCDAHHETAPDLDGIVRSILDAHQRAGVAAEDIDLLMAHGTGTHLNDKTEALALQEIFGNQSKSPFVTGLKSLIGHTSGASALIGVVSAIECMQQSKIPPTIGLQNPIKEAEGLRFVTEAELSVPMQLAQVNAFGFGGVNAVSILEK